MLAMFLLLLLSALFKVQVQAANPGVKATFSNPANASQTFVALLSKPRVMTINNKYDSGNPDWDCQLSQRNCYHWDEMHDWGTFNISVTLEGYITIPWSTPAVYQSALNLLPGSCAKVYLDGMLVQNQCGYPVFNPNGGNLNASHIDWAGIRDVTSDIDYIQNFGTDYQVPLSSIAKSVMNSMIWVRFDFSFCN
jgi:hypothetical protein